MSHSNRNQVAQQFGRHLALALAFTLLHTKINTSTLLE